MSIAQSNQPNKQPQDKTQPTVNSRHPLYQLWAHIKERCHNPRGKLYRKYGARGIFVCDEWRGNSRLFIAWAQANGWAKGLQIDRIDNNGPYAPWNCRFVDGKENQRNKRDNVFVVAFGERKTVSAWIEDPRCTCCDTALRQRLAKGLPPEVAITRPPIAPRFKRGGHAALSPEAAKGGGT